MALLEVEDIHTFYGNISALRGISLSVEEGEIVTLIGGNGAGKSTTLRSITALTPPRAGTVRFEGKDITATPAADIVAAGISMVPEGRRCFPRMTVRENLELGSYLRNDRRAIREDLDYVFSLFPRLSERLGQMGGTMSGGEQQMLAMGRALMSRPKLILMDEPSMGLAPLFVERIFEIIKQVNERGISVFVVEQNANIALSVADRGYVLQTGEVVLSGAAQDLLHDEGMKRAYLGEV